MKNIKDYLLEHFGEFDPIAVDAIPPEPEYYDDEPLPKKTIEAPALPVKPECDGCCKGECEGECCCKASELGISMNDSEFEELKHKLVDALAEEFNAWYQYVIIRSFLSGPLRPDVVKFFDETAKDELEDHAYWLMDRLNQLGCDSARLTDPAFWNTTATHKYIYPSTDVISAINNNIKAEQGAIETYTALEEFTRDKDIVTNCKIKEILKDEQEHLAELYDLRKDGSGV